MERWLLLIYMFPFINQSECIIGNGSHKGCYKDFRGVLKVLLFVQTTSPSPNTQLYTMKLIVILKKGEEKEKKNIKHKFIDLR